MKFKGLTLIIVIVALCYMGVSISSAHRNSAPNLECVSCHQGEIVDNLVKIEGLPKAFTPGKVYNLTVTISSRLESMSESKGGFAVEASAGKLIVKDKKNTQLSDGILTHTQEGSTLRKWTFSWKAPSKKVDTTITVMAVAANGDYSPAGDRVSADIFTIKSSK